MIINVFFFLYFMLLLQPKILVANKYEGNLDRRTWDEKLNCYGKVKFECTYLLYKTYKTSFLFSSFSISTSHMRFIPAAPGFMLHFNVTYRQPIKNSMLPLQIPPSQCDYYQITDGG